MDGYEALMNGEGTQEPQTVDTPPAADVVATPAPALSEPVQTSEPVAAPAAPVVAPEPAQTQPQNLDAVGLLRALQEERESRQAAQRERDELRRAQAERQRKAQEAANSQIPHPLDDPDGFTAGIQRHTQAAVARAVSEVESRQQQAREEISRVMVEQHLGADGFAELESFMNAAPDQAHAIAMRQPHPYGWFLGKLNEAKEHRKREDALKQLGGKSVDEIVAERVAAELAKRAAEAPSAEPAPQHHSATQPRDQGKFTQAQPQKHEPPSLTVVTGAPSPRGEAARGGYDALFKRG